MKNIVEEYLYLGVRITGSLDLDIMARDRADKGRKALYGLAPILSSSTIPVTIKSRLINAVLVPILSYGGEIWGMSSTRAMFGQRVLSEALRLVVGLKRTSTRTSAATLGQEVGVYQLAAIVSAARTRALFKYPSLRTYIADLVEAPMVSRKRTWVSGSVMWLRRFCRNVLESESPRAASNLVRRALNDRLNRGVTAGRYRECEFGSSVKYLALTAKYLAFSKGLWWLTRIRVNAFWTGRAFERIGWLPARFRNQCPFCSREGTGENVEHFLLVCPAWEVMRQESLRGLLDRGFDSVNLLGGSKHNSGLMLDQALPLWLYPWRDDEPRDDGDRQHNMVVERLPGFVQVAKFLQQVMPIRLRRLAVLLRTPRADAEDNGGMVALQEEPPDVEDPPRERPVGAPT